MILNLSINYHDIELTAEHFNLDLKKEFIIDCSTLIKLQQPNFFSVCEIEGFEKINDQAAKDYIKEIGKVSVANYKPGKSIRKIKVFEYALFWYSTLAIKRPDLSLGKTVFLLDSILPHLVKRIKDEKIFVSIPKNSAHNLNIITQVLKKNGIDNFAVIKGSNDFLLKYVKNSCRLLLFYFKCYSLFLFTKGWKGSTMNKNYFITHTATKIDENYDDFFLRDIKRFSDSISEGEYLPLFNSFKPLKESRPFLSREYGNAFPTLRQFLTLLIVVLKQLLTFRWRGDKNNIAFFAEKRLLEFEIKNSALENMWNFFFGIWLKNYFSKIDHKINLLYQDEYYEIGRVISKTFEDHTYITTIGLQHGLFDLHHTVYGISELEFSNAEGASIPSPGIFAVWGEYFKNYFLSNNAYDESRLKILGSPKYFNIKTVVNYKTVENILWCTATPEITQMEIDFIQKPILSDPAYDITLREHPSKHLQYIEEFRTSFKLFERFPKLKVSNGVSIIEDINVRDMSIMDCYTTAFLDCYLSGKYCLRIFPYKNGPAYLKNYRSSLIFNIFSEDDVFFAMEQIKKSTNTNIYLQEEISKIMHIDNSGWLQILKSNSPEASKYN